MLYETNIHKALGIVSIIQYAINKGHPEFLLFVLKYLISTLHSRYSKYSYQKYEKNDIK